jgi:hypothetical protein
MMRDAFPKIETLRKEVVQFGLAKGFKKIVAAVGGGKPVDAAAVKNTMQELVTQSEKAQKNIVAAVNEAKTIIDKVDAAAELADKQLKDAENIENVGVANKIRAAVDAIEKELGTSQQRFQRKVDFEKDAKDAKELLESIREQFALANAQPPKEVEQEAKPYILAQAKKYVADAKEKENAIKELRAQAKAAFEQARAAYKAAEKADDETKEKGWFSSSISKDVDLLKAKRKEVKQQQTTANARQLIANEKQRDAKKVLQEIEALENRMNALKIGEPDSVQNDIEEQKDAWEAVLKRAKKLLEQEGEEDTINAYVREIDNYVKYIDGFLQKIKAGIQAVAPGQELEKETPIAKPGISSRIEPAPKPAGPTPKPGSFLSNVWEIGAKEQEAATATAKAEAEAKAAADAQAAEQARKAAEKLAQEEKEKKALEEKAKKDKEEAERLARDKAAEEARKEEQRKEAERIAQEKAETERLEKERLALIEQERKAREDAQKAAEKAAAEKKEQEQQEAARLAKEAAEKKEQEQQEAARLAKEAADKKAAEQKEAEAKKQRTLFGNAAAARAEKQREAREAKARTQEAQRKKDIEDAEKRATKKKEEAIAAQKEAERLEKEAADKAAAAVRAEQEKIAAEKAAQEKAEAERVAKEEAERARVAEEKRVADEAARVEADKLAKVERDRKAAEEAQKAKQEKEEAERAAKEAAEKAAAAEQAEKERAERERIETLINQAVFTPFNTNKHNLAYYNEQKILTQETAPLTMDKLQRVAAYASVAVTVGYLEKVIENIKKVEEHISTNEKLKNFVQELARVAGSITTTYWTQADAKKRLDAVKQQFEKWLGAQAFVGVQSGVSEQEKEAEKAAQAERLAKEEAQRAKEEAERLAKEAAEKAAAAARAEQEKIAAAQAEQAKKDAEKEKIDKLVENAVFKPFTTKRYPKLRYRLEGANAATTEQNAPLTLAKLAGMSAVLETTQKIMTYVEDIMATIKPVLEYIPVHEGLKNFVRELKGVVDSIPVKPLTPADSAKRLNDAKALLKTWLEEGGAPVQEVTD